MRRAQQGDAREGVQLAEAIAKADQPQARPTLSAQHAGRRATTRSFKGAALAVGALTVGLLVSACSSLKPHVFSERIQTPCNSAAASAPTTGPGPAGKRACAVLSLEQGLAEAESLRRDYLRAVQSLGEEAPRRSLAMVVLSTFGIFQAVTQPDSKDLAAIGALGSGLWAFGSATPSVDRQRVWLAGAEALACAQRAMHPYQEVSHGTEGPWLDIEVRSLRDAREALRSAQEQARPLGEDVVHRTQAKPRPGECSQAAVDCATLRPDRLGGQTPEARRAQCQRAMEQRDRVCKASEASTVTLQPAARVKVLLDQVDRELDALNPLLRRATEAQAELRAAPDDLIGAVDAVEVAVGREILRVEPSPDAVRAVLARQSVVAMEWARAPAPAEAASGAGAGKKVSGESDRIGSIANSKSTTSTKTRPLSQEQQRLVEALDQALRASREARLPVEHQLDRLRAAQQRRNKAVTECKVVLPPEAPAPDRAASS